MGFGSSTIFGAGASSGSGIAAMRRRRSRGTQQHDQDREHRGADQDGAADQTRHVTRDERRGAGRDPLVIAERGRPDHTGGARHQGDQLAGDQAEPGAPALIPHQLRVVGHLRECRCDARAEHEVGEVWCIGGGVDPDRGEAHRLLGDQDRCRPQVGELHRGFRIIASQVRLGEHPRPVDRTRLGGVVELHAPPRDRHAEQVVEARDETLRVGGVAGDLARHRALRREAPAAREAALRQRRWRLRRGCGRPATSGRRVARPNTVRCAGLEAGCGTRCFPARSRPRPGRRALRRPPRRWPGRDRSIQPSAIGSRRPSRTARTPSAPGPDRCPARRRAPRWRPGRPVSRTAAVTIVPAGVCTRAFASRFAITWCRRGPSPLTMTGSSGSSSRHSWSGPAALRVSHGIHQQPGDRSTSVPSSSRPSSRRASSRRSSTRAVIRTDSDSTRPRAWATSFGQLVPATAGQLGVAADGGERRAELVARVGDEGADLVLARLPGRQSGCDVLEHAVERDTHPAHLGARVGVVGRDPLGERDLAPIQRELGDPGRGRRQHDRAAAARAGRPPFRRPRRRRRRRARSPPMSRASRSTVSFTSRSGRPVTSTWPSGIGLLMTRNSPSDPSVTVCGAPSSGSPTRPCTSSDGELDRSAGLVQDPGTDQDAVPDERHERALGLAGLLQDRPDPGWLPAGVDAEPDLGPSVRIGELVVEALRRGSRGARPR